ncbi:response regulator SirA [Mesorhizobium erdmanii]|uniref:Response regulator SirA n=1 Tax=Mesorhizobium erdmanii TaxID=1777866 RepID=A0A6M7UDW0_9HYPH|nr:response regulator SirA [Mesorhizobium erdmanii]
MIPILAADTAIYDLKGLNCPLPVLKAKKRLAGMKPGSRLWLETTDPLAVIDIPAFCADTGHQLIETAAMSGGHRFLVERGGQGS